MSDNKQRAEPPQNVQSPIARRCRLERFVFGKLVIFTILFSSLSPPLLQATEIPPNATVLDPDIVWDVANPDSFAVSSDGKQIAYISKGAIWLCGVDVGPPTKLVDLPNTTTSILAEPKYLEQREESARSPHDRRFTALTGPVHAGRDYVFGLGWTSSQDGLFYTVRKRVGNNTPVTAYHVMHVSLAGEVDEIAVIEGQFGIPYEEDSSFHVTKNRKHVVVSYYSTLIWDVARARPQATPYDRLVPSSASGRFLGIEIDTRQLVLVDEQFAIAKRFDVTFPVERMVDLTWSDDEHFAICRTHNEYGSQGATAFRINLETGHQTPSVKCNVSDRFLFIGAEGEFLQLRVANQGIWGYMNGEAGTRAIVVEPDGESRHLFTTKGFRKPEKGQWGSIFPPMIAAADGSRIAFALPRPEDQAPGAQYHLIDLQGRTTPLEPVSDASYITPYFPITFADEGRRLIARSGSTLFSVPVNAGDLARETRDDE